MNAVAGQNSCVGPWTATMNVRLGYSQSFPGIGKRVTMSLNVANPLTGLDLLLHGSNDLRGWGGPAFPDPTLLFVRGFNAATKSYVYDVNPRFGSTQSGTTAILNPFRLTLNMSVDLGRDPFAQQVAVTLRAPRALGGDRAPVDTIKSRLLTGGTTAGNGPQDMYKMILSVKDSLALSADQIARLQAAQVSFRAKVDSMYTDLANSLVALPPTYDGGVISKRMQDVSKATWQYMADQGKPIQAILTPTQMQLLWRPVLLTLTTKFNANSYWFTGAAAWF
jgi:hypothetical protein